MEIKRLKKFKDNKLIDELVIHGCDIKLSMSGTARYEFIIKSEKSEILICMWTSIKGQIETRIDSNHNFDDIITENSVGNIEQLNCYCTSLHLEHMDRRHYCLCLNTTNTELTIDFLTNGYLKTRIK